MGEFQCSSSWGYPEVLRFRYQSYRDYSGLLFVFDRRNRSIRVESTKIRDPRVLCFSWDFESDSDVDGVVDKLVAIGRLAELSCEKSACAVPAFWSSEVEFKGKINACSNSSEYPMSVLSFEEGIMRLMNQLARGMDVEPCKANRVSIEFTVDGKRSEFRISDWGEIVIGCLQSKNMLWASYKLVGSYADDMLRIMNGCNINRPENYIEREGTDLGSIVLNFSKGSYRIDVDGVGPVWWDRFIEEVLELLDRIVTDT